MPGKRYIGHCLCLLLPMILITGCGQGGHLEANSTTMKMGEDQMEGKTGVQAGIAVPWKQALGGDDDHTIHGEVRILDSFPMTPLDTKRRIWIYLPQGYDKEEARYPVLYMQDGQNLFDKATSYAGEWGIDETMLRLETENPGLKTIVVGIDNGGENRANEYIPWPDQMMNGQPVGGGQGDLYADFLAQTLKPYIDSHYRTLPERESTAIAGSSLGAYISLYTAMKYQDLFGRVGAFSTIDTFDEGKLIESIQKQGKKEDIRIYLDAGSKEEDQFPGVIDANRMLKDALVSARFAENQVKLVVDPNGIHHEDAWNRRFPDAWKWLMETDN